MRLRLSEISLSHLYRLRQIVNEKAGKNFILRDEKELLALMSYCEHSTDIVIKNQYQAFLRSLDATTLSELNTKKIKLVTST